MQHPATALDAVTTTSGFLLVLSIVVPVAGILLAVVVGGRHVERIAFAIILLGLAIATAILVALQHSDGPLVYLLGAWARISAPVPSTPARRPRSGYCFSRSGAR
jgi:multicomponent Na+:H+ antiporter subunit D